MPWKTLWPVIKDVGLTALGMFCIYSQITSPHPSGLVLGTGLALTVPSVASHVKALLPGGTDGESSPSSRQRGSSSSSGGQ